jgi:hypothetical protein
VTETVRWTVAGLVMASLLACTSMRPVEASPEELAARIRQGNVVQVGEKVTIVTKDGRKDQFTVTAIDEFTVKGNKESIPIDDIVALKTKEISLGKTALLTGGIGLTFYLLLGIALSGAAIGGMQ